MFLFRRNILHVAYLCGILGGGIRMLRVYPEGGQDMERKDVWILKDGGSGV